MHLYLHIPFCHHICPYCGFYKHRPGRLANQLFVDALLTEARLRAPLVSAPLRTIYWGGGTPSLLSSSLLARLCEGLTSIFDTSQVQEWTMEANPATFDLKKASVMRAGGVNRISLGVQSFQSGTLSTLGRDHTGDEAIAAYRILREAGFENVSIDLMFSIPGQDKSSWQADLEQAIELRPEHVSAYNLTYEEDTEFLKRHQQGELDTDTDRDADQFYDAIETLESAGWEHYEISNYARPGYESAHNRAYWSGADYLGLGPGAVSTWNHQRWKTLPDTAAYVNALQSKQDVRVEIETLSAEDRRIEAIAMQLRTREGMSAELIDAPDTVSSLIEQGWIQLLSGRITLTHAGKALADPIAAALL